MEEMMRELELYVHIPFCVRKCAYCDFLSAPAGEEERQRYVETLIEELKGYRKQYQEYRVTTVFAGGGTPSLLTGKQVEEIFAVLRECFVIEEDAEITIEVNPGTVTEEKAEAWKRAGINRISIGLQSACDEELRMLGRIHTFQEFLETYELLRRTGFANLNVDLISAIPGQTAESWRETIRTVAELSPEHISAYSLIVEEGTLFYERYGEKQGGNHQEWKEHTALKGLLDLPDEETERLIYEETEQLLQKYGYHRYEISNYAKAGYDCRHNKGYWRRTEYLGTGLGASSLIGHWRFCNLKQYDEYVDAVWNKRDLHEEAERLDVTDEMEEFMFLGLRMMEGIQRSEFYEAFGEELETVYGEQLRKLEQEGLIEADEKGVRLTKRGIDISNYVFVQFLLPG